MVDLTIFRHDVDGSDNDHDDRNREVNHVVLFKTFHEFFFVASCFLLIPGLGRLFSLIIAAVVMDRPVD